MSDVIMPQMGESIAEGTVTKWMKKVGEKVDRDEPLFEISTDKVDAEIPSPVSGTLAEIRVEPGSTVPINTVVGVIAPTPSPAQTPEAPEASAHPTASPAPAVAPPASPDPAPHRAQPALPRHPEQRVERSAEELRQTRSSPVVRRIASEHGVDIGQIKGTGVSGRVTKQDILGHIAIGVSPVPGPVGPASPPPGPAPAGESRPTPSLRPGERVEVVPMSPIRKRTAEHMVLSKRTSAHVTTLFEVDMSFIQELRRQHGPTYERSRGVKLSYLPFILKATIDALRAHPVLNSSVEGDTIVYKKNLDIGVAVALDWGLIVPVIHNADEKNVLGLARAVNDLAERARAKKLKVEEVQGGTFTVTNPGVFGSLFGTPIIHQPQVAILGVGTIEKRPVIRSDAIAIRTMTYLALSFDHRVVDGSDADRFMAHVKKGLEEFDESSL
jgi:pyruvate dehydrogenase E2 component (dihydrolipoamide acetyltransferase)